MTYWHSATANITGFVSKSPTYYAIVTREYGVLSGVFSGECQVTLYRVFVRGYAQFDTLSLLYTLAIRSTGVDLTNSVQPPKRQLIYTSHSPLF